jgi:hypothetical protein
MTTAGFSQTSVTTRPDGVFAQTTIWNYTAGKIPNFTKSKQVRKRKYCVTIMARSLIVLESKIKHVTTSATLLQLRQSTE